MKLDLASNTFVEPESLDQLTRIRKAISFHQNVFNISFFQQGVQSVDKVIFGRAADASIWHFVEVLNVLPICIFHQSRLDAHIGRKFILNYCHLFIQFGRFQDGFDQSGFAGAQESNDYDDFWNFMIH